MPEKSDRALAVSYLRALIVNTHEEFEKFIQSLRLALGKLCGTLTKGIVVAERRLEQGRARALLAAKTINENLDIIHPGCPERHLLVIAVRCIILGIGALGVILGTGALGVILGIGDGTLLGGGYANDYTGLVVEELTGLVPVEADEGREWDKRLGRRNIGVRGKKRTQSDGTNRSPPRDRSHTRNRSRNNMVSWVPIAMSFALVIATGNTILAMFGWKIVAWRWFNSTSKQFCSGIDDLSLTVPPEGARSCESAKTSENGHVSLKMHLDGIAERLKAG